MAVTLLLAGSGRMAAVGSCCNLGVFQLSCLLVLWLTSAQQMLLQKLLLKLMFMALAMNRQHSLVPGQAVGIAMHGMCAAVRTCFRSRQLQQEQSCISA
jgi:hypothetical protein